MESDNLKSDDSWEDIADQAPKFYYREVDERLAPHQYKGSFHPNVPTLHLYECYEDVESTKTRSFPNNLHIPQPYEDMDDQGLQYQNSGSNNFNDVHQQQNPLSNSIMPVPDPQFQFPQQSMPVADPSFNYSNGMGSSINNQFNHSSQNRFNYYSNNPSSPTFQHNIGSNLNDQPRLRPSENQGFGTMQMPTIWQDSNHGNYENTEHIPMQSSHFIPMPQPESPPAFYAPPPPAPSQPSHYNETPSFQAVPQHAPLPPGAPNVVPVSNFTGRKKALLIGINYFRTPYALKGCINDVRNIQRFLNVSYNFPLEGMVVLTDDQVNNPSRMPTKRNILAAMKWLVDGARPNDSLFFHYSGHGSQTPDLNGDEEDGFDETICPLDFQTQGQIVDDEMNLILVQPLPEGCRLTAIFDCCHSGTILDLPYVYSSTGKLKSFNPAKSAFSTLVDVGSKTQMGDLVGALQTLKSGAKTLMNGHRIEKENQAKKGGLADVIMFSGCKDDQTSADALDNDLGNTGAMSMALVTALYERSYSLSYLDLLHNIRKILADKKYTQVPQLSTARPMDMNSLFRM